jgi:hypothetical protein
MATRREKYWAAKRGKYWATAAQKSLEIERTVENRGYIDALPGIIGKWVPVELGGPYSRAATCRYRGNQTMYYRGKHRSYVSPDAGAPISRNKIETYYRGKMSRFDGPCRRINYGEVSLEFAWGACGRTVRAGGLPVVEYSMCDGEPTEIFRKWGAKSGFVHRHSGPAITHLTESDEPYETDLGFTWYSRGHAHCASGPSGGENIMYRYCSSGGDTTYGYCRLEWHHYGAARK